MKIKVKQEHIDRGAISSCSHCPIALAMMEAGFRRPSVGYDTVRWGDEGLRNTTKTPTAVSESMYLFDIGHGMKPFEFEISV